MKKDIKERWVKGLLSGNYKEATGNLKSISGFSCLGVLCDIYSKEKKIPWKNHSEDYPKESDYKVIHFNRSFLPIEVQEWAGLNTMDPQILGKSLTHYEESFKEIAALIEQNL